MNKSRVAIAISQIIEKIEIVIGTISAVIGLFGMFTTISESSREDIAIECFMVVMFLGGGIWIFLKGNKRKKMRVEFKKYVAQLSIDSTGYIDNIAASTGTSADKVKKNIEFMIRKRFFSNAYIDEKNGRLIIPNLTKNMPNEDSMQANEYKQDIVYKTCHCPNCGGVSKIIQGKVGECDFCGSPLQG